MAAVYLLCLAASLVILTAALRHRPASAPELDSTPPPCSVGLPVGPDEDGRTEIRQILTAAHALAARLDTAA